MIDGTCIFLTLGVYLQVELCFLSTASIAAQISDLTKTCYICFNKRPPTLKAKMWNKRPLRVSAPPSLRLISYILSVIGIQGEPVSIVTLYKPFMLQSVNILDKIEFFSEFKRLEMIPSEICAAIKIIFLIKEMCSVRKVLTKPRWYKLLAIKASCFFAFLVYFISISATVFYYFLLPPKLGHSLSNFAHMPIKPFSRAYYFGFECLRRFF